MSRPAEKETGLAPTAASGQGSDHRVMGGYDQSHGGRDTPRVEAAAALYSHKNWLRHMVSFPVAFWLFSKNANKHLCQCLYMVNLCIVMSGHEKGKMPQESHMPQLFLGSTDLYEQCMYRMADSCTKALSEPIMKEVQARL